MPRFRKRPVEVEAVLWTGDNFEEISRWADWKVISRWPDGGRHGRQISILTLEGAMEASVGDWIVRGVKGEFYPCKPDIFALTYEHVPDHAEPTD